MNDFAGDRECVTHHACSCIAADARRARQLAEDLDRVREVLLSIASGEPRADAPLEVHRERCQAMAREAHQALVATSPSEAVAAA